MTANRLLTVSNRGPVEYSDGEDGSPVAMPGQGGLATALRVAADLHPTTWLSSPMSPTDRRIAEKRLGVEMASRFVLTEPAAYDLFYGRFSNEVLWFLQHGLPWPDDLNAASRRDAWDDGYLPVNQTFAHAVIDAMGDEETAVMFHDYHFYVAPGIVKKARPGAYLQHFIHIPWPGPERWHRLERDLVAAICEGLLGNDSVAFQTPADARNFLQTCRAYLPRISIDEGAGMATLDGRNVRVWANPISVDPEDLEREAKTPEFSRYRWLLRPGPDQKTILRVDRLDLTKNVVRGFEAYDRLLTDHPELREHVQFIAALVPSKTDIPSYRDYQEEAMAAGTEINRKFGNRHWRPVNLIFEHNRVQALAAMSLYDVLLVNPIADGMNLVAKEGPVLNNHDGVLVLSRTAGAWNELSEGAIGVDPEDVEGTAAALYEALTMPGPERRRRHALLDAAIHGHVLRDWFTALLEDIERNASLGAAPAA
jgi:trehalose 6-phosphate synthase